MRLPERSITVLDRDGAPAATIRLGIDIAVNDALEELRPLVSRDRTLWQTRKDASVEFREARMRMGAALLRWRRGISNNHAWGRILNALALNRHTAHQACRLAAELCDEWGAIDHAKLSEAKARGDGLLRRTAEGQRLLEAEPGQLRLMDMRRLLRAGRRANQTKTSVVDARQQRYLGNERAADQTKTSGVDTRQQRYLGNERAAGQTKTSGVDTCQHIDSGYERAAGRAETLTCDPGAARAVPVAAPGRTLSLPLPEPGAAGAGPAPAVPALGGGAGGAGGVGGAGGAQLHFDFEAAASRVVRRVKRLLDEMAIDPGVLDGRDMAEGADLLGRLDAWLAGGRAGGASGAGGAGRVGVIS